MTNFKIDMDEKPEDKKKINRLDLSNEESKEKDGSIENMKIDMGTYESDFVIPESKNTLKTLDWNTDMFSEEDGQIYKAPKELRQLWADREAWKLMKDCTHDDISPYSRPNKKSSMYIPSSYEEDYSDDKNLKVQQTPETYKIGTGTPSELRKELNKLKEVAKKLESLKPYVGASTYSNILFEFNKDILPRIKYLESQLSLNVSVDYVDSELKELGDQILKKYNLDNEEELTEDEPEEEVKTLEQNVEKSKSSMYLEDKPDYKLDSNESENQIYEIDGRMFLIRPDGEMFEIDFKK